MSADIYALYSTRDGRVRYVGESGDRVARFKEHLRSAETSPNGCPVSKWFHREWRAGYPVRYALLEVCDFDKRFEVETEWIRRFPWGDLLNRHKRPFWLSVVKPPRIAQIDNYRRGHIFNVDGFRGVHYSYHADCYRVLVYNGRWVKWLDGDESVWDIRYIWFSDLARALDARDNKEHFNRAVMEARRFKDIIAAHAREQERLRTEPIPEWD